MSKQPINQRVLVFTFDDGHTAAIPVNDFTVFRVDEGTFAVKGVKNLAIEDAALWELESDALTDVDLGTPVAEWGRRR